MWRRPSELSLLRYIESSARRRWARPSRSQQQTPAAQAGNVAHRSAIMCSKVSTVCFCLM
ncbi:hypothetical protein BHE74_00021645 [Ensete ventricosum]|nr:hypothetical protein BHE74_00021645 [Ensete ventricosum]